MEETAAENKDKAVRAEKRAEDMYNRRLAAQKTLEEA